MKKITFTALFTLLQLVTFSTFAQQDFNTRKKHFNTDASGLALEGYDAVSYFEQKPVQGKHELFLYHRGIKYLFATQAHLDAFKASPEKYEPAYGGWCAYAMGKKGEKVEVDPMKYKIVEGRLCLFYYSVINNTLNKWNEDEATLKPEADKNWNRIVKN
jgi:YHS domain-containing protein